MQQINKILCFKLIGLCVYHFIKRDLLLSLQFLFKLLYKVYRLCAEFKLLLSIYLLKSFIILYKGVNVEGSIPIRLLKRLLLHLKVSSHRIFIKGLRLLTVFLKFFLLLMNDLHTLRLNPSF